MPNAKYFSLEKLLLSTSDGSAQCTQSRTVDKTLHEFDLSASIKTSIKRGTPTSIKRGKLTTIKRGTSTSIKRGKLTSIKRGTPTSIKRGRTRRRAGPSAYFIPSHYTLRHHAPHHGHLPLGIMILKKVCMPRILFTNILHF